MEAQLTAAHPEIRANAGKVAIERGPLVYCLEEIDNAGPLAAVSLVTSSALAVNFDSQLLGGAIVIEAEGRLDEQGSWQEETPYRPYGQQQASLPVKLKAVPYYLWGNRQLGEMTVWIRA
jgi:DUF1680 family protein